MFTQAREVASTCGVMGLRGSNCREEVDAALLGACRCIWRNGSQSIMEAACAAAVAAGGAHHDEGTSKAAADAGVGEGKGPGPAGTAAAAATAQKTTAAATAAHKTTAAAATAAQKNTAAGTAAAPPTTVEGAGLQECYTAAPPADGLQECDTAAVAANARMGHVGNYAEAVAAEQALLTAVLADPPSPFHTHNLRTSAAAPATATPPCITHTAHPRAAAAPPVPTPACLPTLAQTHTTAAAAPAPVGLLRTSSSTAGPTCPLMRCLLSEECLGWVHACCVCQHVCVCVFVC